jgi:hypothetical protein
MNSVLLASAAPVFVAYGDRESPFSQTNLILTGSLLGFLVTDDVIDMFAGKSKAMRGVATTWSYLAPIANGALAYFLFRNTQNERFVSGLTTIDATTGTGKVDLNGTIGSSDIDDFNSSSHAVVATIVDGSAPDKTIVRDVRASLGSDGPKLTVDPAPHQHRHYR